MTGSEPVLKAKVELLADRLYDALIQNGNNVSLDEARRYATIAVHELCVNTRASISEPMAPVSELATRVRRHADCLDGDPRAAGWVTDLRQAADYIEASTRTPGAVDVLVEALATIGGQAICYGMKADENELRDWLKFISETAESALAQFQEKQS